MMYGIELPGSQWMFGYQYIIIIIIIIIKNSLFYVPTVGQ